MYVSLMETVSQSERKHTFRMITRNTLDGANLNIRKILVFFILINLFCRIF
jgi:hypothetical protein